MDKTKEKKTGVRKCLLVSALTLGMGALLLGTAGLRIPAAGVWLEKLHDVRKDHHLKQLRSDLQIGTNYTDAVAFIEDSRKWDVLFVAEHGYTTQCYVPVAVGCVVDDWSWKEVTIGTRCVYIADSDCCYCLVFDEGDKLDGVYMDSER